MNLNKFEALLGCTKIRSRASLKGKWGIRSDFSLFPFNRFALVCLCKLALPFCAETKEEGRIRDLRIAKRVHQPFFEQPREPPKLELSTKRRRSGFVRQAPKRSSHWCSQNLVCRLGDCDKTQNNRVGGTLGVF